jgi:DNA (cytosine-5)-methyltransferase 1
MGKALSYTDCSMPQVNGQSDDSEGWEESDGYAGFVSGISGTQWETEPGLGRVANGVPNRVGQLKGYGNAQVPLQAAAAWRLLGGE